jgi:BirA family biotin operon repressor/biotin-[acetyl-CoA-carboxylase] ligase
MPLWQAESFWQSISPTLPDFSVEILPEIDSTNSELMRRARAGRVEPVLLVAEHQTAGRGRLGRQWHSPAPSAGSLGNSSGHTVSASPSSLTFSLGLPLAPVDWSGLSLVAGVVVAEALHPQLGLKWPNDLWWQDRKMGGILVETVVVAGSIASDFAWMSSSSSSAVRTTDSSARYVVIGIGLNITPDTVEMTSAQGVALRTPAACLQEVLPEIEAPAVLARVAAPLVFATLAFASQGFEPWRARFEARDVLRGRPVEMSDGAAHGIAEGVDGEGGLLIRTGESEVKVVHSAEASVRPRVGR